MKENKSGNPKGLAPSCRRNERLCRFQRLKQTAGNVHQFRPRLMFAA
jgi:hypothetical protein